MTKTRRNCWEYMQCGRQPAGERVPLIGLCPAATAEELDGINNGDAAGRFCWVVEGTLCPGDDEDRIRRCLNCPFLREVAIQEGEFFILGIEISGDVL